MTIDDTLLRDLVPPDVAKKIEDKHEADRYNKGEMGQTAVVVKSSNPADRPLLEYIKGHPGGLAIPSDPLAPGVEIAVPYSYFNFHGITRSLSGSDVEPSVISLDVQNGDRLIITSDGVHNYALSSEMENILNNPDNQNAAKAAEALVKFAKKGELIPGVQPGWPKDDTTAVVVEIK